MLVCVVLWNKMTLAALPACYVGATEVTATPDMHPLQLDIYLMNR